MNILSCQVFRGVYSVLEGKHSVNDFGLDDSLAARRFHGVFDDVTCTVVCRVYWGNMQSCK